MVRRVLFLAALFSAVAVSAQDGQELNPLNTFSNDDCARVVRYDGRSLNRNYLNVGYVLQTSFDQAFNDGPPLTANTKKGWGMSVVYGRSYVLHREPVANVLHFGIDATWIDVNYAKGKTIRLNGGNALTHQLDLGMGVGPAVHIAAARDLTVDVHFRYNPTFATYYNEKDGWEDVRFGYASMWTTGAAATWKTLSLGAEVRFGRGNYYTPDWEKVADDVLGEYTRQHPGDIPGGPGSGGGNPIAGTTDDRVMKLRTIGARLYLGLRF